MNSRLSQIKDCIKSHLKKRIDFNENHLSFFTIPYSINLTGEGMEAYIPAIVNISLDKNYTIGYFNSGSDQSTIYDFNNLQVYSFSPSRNYSPGDEYGAILCKCAETVSARFNLKFGVSGVVNDDFHSGSLSSPTLKFTSLVTSLLKTNKIQFTGQVFSSILEDTNKNLLSIRLDMHEIPSFLDSIENHGIKQEKFHWSEFNNLKIVQISFEKKRLRNEIRSKFSGNIIECHNLLKVLKASARVNSLADFSNEQISGFIRRVPREKQHVINYLFRESVISKKCVNSLRTKNLDSFLKTVNESGINLVELDIANPKISKLLFSLQADKNILALKISPVNSSLTCYIPGNDEDSVLSEIKRKIEVLFPADKDNISIYSSNISGIYVHSFS